MSGPTRQPLTEVLDFREGPGIMAADFRDAGTPLIRLAGLKRGASLLAGCNYLDPDMVAKRWSQFELAEGDVLLSTSASLGEVAVVGKDGIGAIPYTGIIRFRPKDDQVEPKFIEYALSSPDFREQIAAMGVGSVMKHFGPTHLRQMTVLVPPRPQQKAIAEVLGVLGDKIAANDRLVTSADQLADALLLSAAGAETCRVDEIASLTMGSSPPGTSYNETGDGLPFYQGVRDFGVRSPSRRVWTTAPGRLAEADDTLVSVRAPVGRTNVAAETCCIGRGLAAVQALDGRTYTLYYALRATDGWAPYEAEGTVFGSINKKQLAAIDIPAVPVSMQEGVETRLAGLGRHSQSLLRENDVLRELRDTLLPALMSGRLSVKDAENTVSEVV